MRLNRYLLLRRSAVDQEKASILRQVMLPHLDLKAIRARFDSRSMTALKELAASVLVGADDIPTRWQVQDQMPCWLGIGATSHWAAMAS